MRINIYDVLFCRLWAVWRVRVAGCLRWCQVQQSWSFLTPPRHRLHHYSLRSIQMNWRLSANGHAVVSAGTTQVTTTKGQWDFYTIQYRVYNISLINTTLVCRSMQYYCSFPYKARQDIKCQSHRSDPPQSHTLDHCSPSWGSSTLCATTTAQPSPLHAWITWKPVAFTSWARITWDSLLRRINASSASVLSIIES